MINSEHVLQQLIWGNTVEGYLWFFGIIFFGLLLLRFLSRSFSQLLFKFFKKFAKDVKGEKFVELLLKPAELLVLICTFYFAINQLSYPLNEVLFKRKDFLVTYIDVIDKIFLFLITVSITWVVLRIIDFVGLVFLHKATLTESKEDDQIVPFVKELVKILTTVIAVFVLLSLVFEINVLTLITGLGIGGIAIALAAKESLENLLGSFTIFFDKPFLVGDLVRVDGLEGTVEKVGFRSTLIRTLDKSILMVPNKKMIDGLLENLTLRNFRRVKFNIGLTYSTSPDSVRKIVKEITQLIRTTPHCSEDGIAIFEEFGEYSLQIMVLCFIDMMEYNNYLAIREEINYKITEIVYANKSDFAFPTRTIRHVGPEISATDD